MLTEALAARQEEIGRAIAQRVVAEIPEYARAPEDVLEDLVQGATTTAGLLTRAFEGRLERSELTVIRDLAARRVHQGVSLDGFLHAYRVALFEYWDACAEEAERANLTRAASLDLARAALDAMDLMTSHAAEGYLREEARLRAESGRVARDAIERLLRGLPAEHVRLPRPPFVVAVGHGEVPEGALAAVREGEVVVIAANATALDGRFGVSLPVGAISGIPQAYREAALALTYAGHTRPVVALAELSAFECLLVGADPTTRAVIAAKPLPTGEDAATVRAFAAADLNVTRAAQALHVHPNTVRYRLGRIAEQTGLDPRTFKGLVELEVRTGIATH